MTRQEGTVTLETEALPGPIATDREAWLQWREDHIGASEAGAAMGISPYQQPLDIYNLKTGVVQQKEANFAMRWGSAVEHIIAQEYSNRTGKTLLYPIPGYRHPDEQHIGATPDAVRADNQKIIVEMKAAGTHVDLGQEHTDEIPAAWIAQAQCQMFVTGADLVEFAVVQSNQLGLYAVERNDEFIATMVERMTELWSMIQDRHPPDADWEHATTGKALAALINCDNDFIAPLGGYELDLINEYTELGREIKEKEKERDKCKHIVMSGLSGHALGRLPDGRVLKMTQITVQPQRREGYSYKRLNVPKRKESRVTRH